MKDLIASLGTVLGDAYAMSIKAQGAHWNVEGPMFSQYHDFFSNIYEDVYSSIDPIAENIRKLGAYAPYGLTMFDKLRDVRDTKVGTDPEALCEDLSTANDIIIANIAVAFKEAIAANEQGIANYLAERDDMHKKWRWQLEASGA